jgi:hypothetical protein
VLVTDMDASRPNPDKHLVVGNLGLRNLRKPQYVGGAIRVLHDRLHCGFSRRRPMRVANHRSGLGLRCHELFAFDPMGGTARRTLYKRLPYKVWECYRPETQS